MSVALVTGGGGAIGRAIAIKLAHNGFDVAAVDIDEAAASATAGLVAQTGRKAVALKADVSDSVSLARVVAESENALGPITAFANNAGIEGVIAPIFDYPDEVFDQLWSVNARGVFLGLKHVLKRMHGRGAGAVVNTASTSAIRGRAGLAGYVATKHAVLGLTRVAALDMAGTQVRVNAVLPGPIESRMIRSLDEQASKRPGSLVRAGAAPYGTPENVAAIVAFLLSDKATHVNGAAWTVDGGSTIA